MQVPNAEKTGIQAVVFDLDDTLYPERDYVRSGYCAAVRHLRGKLRTDRAVPAGELLEAWLWNRFLAACAGAESPPGFRGGAFDAMNAHFGLGLDRGGIAELVAAYRGHTPDIRPYDGAAEMLGILHADYSLGLLSDGFLPAQRLKLDALRIERFFDAVLLTEELGRAAWKPSPAGFERIAVLLGSPHGACAYVADNPEKDFVAPNALGWRTIQYLRPGQIHARKPAPGGGEAQFHVRSPGDLAAVLKEGWK